jgi:hypothetical protein
MVGMQTQFGRGRYVDAIANRGIQSGGSIGGVKKAGMWTGQPFMSVYNIGNHWTYRIPQRQPSVLFALRNSTKRPVQYNRNGYYASHSGQLG